MGWFSDIVDSISDAFSGSSSSSSSGYEQEAYGGSKREYYNALGGQSDSDSDSSSMGASQAAAIEAAEQAKAKAAQEELERRKAAEAQAEAARLARLEQERRRNTDAFTSYLTSQGMLGNGLNVTDEQAADYFQQETALKGMLAPQDIDFRVGNVGKLEGNVSGEFAGGDFTDQYYYDIADDFGTLATNFLTPKIMGAMAGNLTGTIGYDVTGNPMLAGQAATGVDAVTKGILSRSKIADTVQLADGTIGYVTNIAGQQGFTTRDAVTERNIAQALEDQKNNDSDDNNAINSIGTGLAMAANLGPRKPSWRDYYSGGFTFDPTEFATQMLSGGLTQSNLKSVQLAGRIVGGEDFASAAFGVYGDELNKILPEGYEKPTQAGIRIGLGENRVAVLGDIYGEDFNLDTPMGKAGLEGAEVYDMTGDADKALQKSVYTYFKEGGKIPGEAPKLENFEVPDFLPDVNLDIDVDWLKEAGFSIKEALDFLPPMNFGDLNIDLGSIGDLEGIDLGKFNFEGVKVGDLGISLPKAKELGIDMKELDFGEIDLPSIELGLEAAAGSGGVVLEDDAEYTSLDSEFDISQDDSESLARKLIRTAV